MSTVAAWLALLWAVASGWLALAALVMRARLACQTASAAGDLRALRAVLVRPCAGSEPGLEERLVSISRAQASFSLHVLFATSSQNDAAVPAIERAVATLQAGGIRATHVVVGPRGANRKAALLAGVLERAGDADVLINADSNIDLSDVDLDALVGRLSGRTAAVWMPPIEVASSRRLGSRASEAVLTESLHAFPLLAGLDPNGLVGKLFAVDTRAVIRAGGLWPLVDYLGEDAELSRRLRQAGYRIEPATAAVRATAGPQSLAETIARHARWMQVIRGQRPALLVTYPLFFFPTVFILGLAIAGGFAQPTVAIVAVAVAALARMVVALGARAASGLPSRVFRAPLAAALADAVMLAAFVRSVMSRRVAWRDHRLRLIRGGRIATAR